MYGVQEAGSSNLLTQTKKRPESLEISVFCFLAGLLKMARNFFLLSRYCHGVS